MPNVVNESPILPSRDAYGVVCNSKQTYDALADILIKSGRVMIAWTDQDGSQLDVVFNVVLPHFGPIQRGLMPFTDLTISIIGIGAFGFDLAKSDSYPSYIGEKLNLGLTSSTTVKVTQLINQLRKSINIKVKQLPKAAGENK